MDRSSRADPIRSDDHKRLRELAETFHEAWKNATSVDIQPFLPPPGDPLRPLALRELVKADLHFRWQRGQRVLLDAYLTRYPELGPPQGLPADLLFEEFRVRQLHGQLPDPAEYQRRFPTQFSQLELMLRPSATEVATAPRPPANDGEPPLAATVTVARATPTQTIKGFKLIKKIGSGSFAEVWQGESGGGFPVAVKRIIKPLDDSEAKREMQALESIKRLRHMFLLQTHDAFVVDNQLFVVMELADGTLRDRMKQCQKQGLPGIPLPELLGYFREAAEALDYMHAQHLFHRDIKPQNILILNGHAKVADFGLATLLDSQKLLMSATGSGTPAYMAPEVWQSKVSRHTDQYSLAAAYAEQRLGRWAFRGEDMMSLMVAHIQGRAELDPLPPAEQAVIRKALSRDPTDRYPSCLAFVHALEEALADELTAQNARLPPRRPHTTDIAMGGTNRPPTGSSTTPQTRRQSGPRSQPSATVLVPPPPRRWPVALLISLLVVAGGVAWYFVPHRQASDASGYALAVPLARTLHAGEASRLSVGVERRGYSGPIQLTLLDLPPGCEVDPKVVLAGESGVELPLRVAPDAAPVASHPVRVRASGEGGEQEKELRLTIKPCWYHFEKNWRKAPDGRLEERDGNRAYYSRIEVQRPDLPMPVRFVLVYQTNPSDPPTFYMMEDKVWVGLFSTFAAKPLRPFKNMEWKQLEVNQKDKDAPVMGVVAADAEQFAHWLGGELPTTRQWDKAVGRYEKPQPAAPYKEPLEPGGVAINLAAPRTRGTAAQDISHFGCHDMAGNGREWTSVEAGETEDLGMRVRDIEKMTEFQQLYVRGKSWNAKEPLSYRELASTQEPKFVLPPKGRPVDYTIGFRVVLELER